MDIIYAVCREKGGAHESMDVMSVWTDKQKANEEKDNLNKNAYSGFEFEVKEWKLNEQGDTINW